MSAAQSAPAKPSASDIARDNLVTDLAPIYRRAHAAGGGVFTAAKHLAGTTDLVVAYAAAARMILALEAMKAAAEQAAKDARSILLASMGDTGCPQVAEGGMTVYPAREPAILVIEDPARIPPDLMCKPPPPAPDREAIKAALKQGRQVPGASILQRNSQRLVIRTGKD
jgi:hypothetical protein